MSEKELIEKIRDICSTNINVDWLETDVSKEFADIVHLINAETEYNKS
jgi:hypothetical protein